MAIGTTIDGLNSVTSLTAQDEVPVWDTEASNEPTKKITAQNMANSVKSLASLPNTTEMNEAIEQSDGDKVVQGTISNAKISDTIRSAAVPIGVSVWQTQSATDSPDSGHVSMTHIVKPLASGQYANCVMFSGDRCYVSNSLGVSGDFTWTEVTRQTRWAKAGEATGTTNITLPTNWDEMVIQISYNNVYLITTVLKAMTTAGGNSISFGNFGTSYAIGLVSRTSVHLQSVRWDNTDVTSASHIYIYCRSY